MTPPSQHIDNYLATDVRKIYGEQAEPYFLWERRVAKALA